jgi:hypothetical protein
MSEDARLFLRSMAVMGLFDPPLTAQRIDLAGESQDGLALGVGDEEQVVDHVVPINLADIHFTARDRKHFRRAFERFAHLRFKFFLKRHDAGA